MNELVAQRLLAIVRSLIAISLGIVVAMLCLALALWLQSRLMESLTHDHLISITSFLLPFLFGGLSAGLGSWTRRWTVALLHGELFALLYLAMFINGWIRSDDIGAGLIAGLVFGGLVLAALGSPAGLWLRQRLLRRRE